MNSVAIAQKNKIHPHKFALWVGIGSILMMFAGLTSAYVVKRSQANWTSFEIPVLFWYSTAAIIASSITMHLAAKAFKERRTDTYRALMAITLALGLAFIALQVFGFVNLWKQGLDLRKNVAYSFLYVIVGLHALHVVGGIVAMLIMYIKALSSKVKTYTSVPLDVLGTYWHFVDLLWVYLLLFLLMIR